MLILSGKNYGHGQGKSGNLILHKEWEPWVSMQLSNGICWVFTVQRSLLHTVCRQPLPRSIIHSSGEPSTSAWGSNSLRGLSDNSLSSVEKKNCLWLFAVEIVKLLTTLSTNRQTSYKLSNISQKLPGIRIQISGLIQVRYWKSTGLLPILWTQYLVGSSYFAKCHKNQPLRVWEMLINLPKSPILQWKSDPESVSKS